ncbi:hypothetical protein TNCV_1588391 [Trichonephila clavipes]|uniref:Uncharacterized protein n=1 Tax=Trichonephila clavipes TaxID=2585209 RepID=A0A8X6V3F3_TRICX|nr:hypothetical protein TNCV_1588391 [Trichonephila clavipes]
MVLKAKPNETSVDLAHCHGEFREPGTDTVEIRKSRNSSANRRPKISKHKKCPNYIRISSNLQNPPPRQPRDNGSQFRYVTGPPFHTSYSKGGKKGGNKDQNKTEEKNRTHYGVRQTHVDDPESGSNPLRDTAGSDHHHRRHGAARHLHTPRIPMPVRQRNGKFPSLFYRNV